MTFHSTAGAIPDFHCAIADERNVSEAIPLDKDGALETCKIYPINSTEKVDCTDGYHFYGDVGDTIVSDVRARFWVAKFN